MDVQHINPFIEAVDAVFDTMVHIMPERQGIRVGNEMSDSTCITSLVGISGAVHGVVVLRFPHGTATAVAGRMLGAEISSMTDDVIDVISELVNMVAGAAKAKFQQEPPLELGLPTVVEGANYKLKYPSRSVWLQVPFESEAGPFTLEVTFGSD